MTRKAQLYLYKYQREHFIKEITQIKELYFERIEPVFADTEGNAKQYEENLHQAASRSIVNGEIDNNDMADLSTWIMEQGYDRYTILEIMKYRTLAMWISCMCQVWEQQISLFLKKEFKTEQLELVGDKGQPIVDFKIDQLWEIFRQFQVEVKSLQCWSKINEMRQLVNVIKHGGGPSASKLKTIRPDFFDTGNEFMLTDGMTKYGVTLLDTTLTITNQDFIDYFNAVIQFWTELPERMYEK